MSGSIEIGKCDVVHPVVRMLYHFDIVRTCAVYEPKPRRVINVVMKPMAQETK